VYNSGQNATISSYLVIQMLEQSGVIVWGSPLPAVMVYNELLQILIWFLATDTV
jgi:hypothetical protein